jgi:O-antigen/teichoic acid export membrane protein
MKQKFWSRAPRRVYLSKFSSDLVALLGSKFILLFLSTITSILLARLLGTSGKGIITTAFVVPGLVLSFADLGLRQTITYFMGKKLYPDQKIISTVSCMILATSTLGITCTFVVYHIMGFQERYGWSVALIPLALIPPRLIITYSTGILMAKAEIPKISLVTLFPEIVFFASIVGLFYFKVSRIELVLFFEVMAYSFSALYILFLIRRYGNITPKFEPTLFVAMTKKGIVYALALFIINLNYRVDIIILEQISSSSQVGVYSIGVTVANLLWLIPNVVNMVNFSHSSNATNIYNYAKKTVFILKVVLWLGMGPFFLLFILSPLLIPLVYGSEFAESSQVVQAILPGVWVMLIFKILNSDLAGRGKPEAALWVYLFTAGINVGLNLIWIPNFGAIGAAWASTVSYTIGGILFAFVYGHLSNIKLRDIFIPSREELKAFFQLVSVLRRKSNESVIIN